MKTSAMFITFVLFCLVNSASAQFNLQEKIKNKTLNRVENKVDQGIDKGLDAAEDGVTGKNKKGDNTETEKAEEENAGIGEAAKPEAKAAVPQEKQSMQTYSKYDFIPGEKVLFFDDFTSTAIGDFPPNWNTNSVASVCISCRMYLSHKLSK